MKIPGTSDPNFVKVNCDELTAAPASNIKLPEVSCDGEVALDGASSLEDLRDFLDTESGRHAASSDTMLQKVFESTVGSSSAKLSPSDLSTRDSCVQVSLKILSGEVTE